MPPKRTEALMEFIDIYLLQAVLNERISTVFSVPTSRTELMAMLIHDIWFSIPANDRIADVAVRTSVSINKWSEGGNIPKLAQDCIASYWESLWYSSDRTVLYDTVGWFPHWHYDPPRLIARDDLRFVLYTENFGAEGQYGNARIGYTLEKVDERAFIAALVR